MKAKLIRKENAGELINQTVNTDDLISDFEFMYRMLRLQMQLDIDEVLAPVTNKAKQYRK